MINIYYFSKKMNSPIQRKHSNHLGFETESKTKSSSLKDEKEIKISNTTNKMKEKIKNIKPSKISLNYKCCQIQKKNNIKDNLYQNINIFHDKKEGNKAAKLDINYIQKNYNLEEAYRKSNILEKLKKNKEFQTFQRMKNFKASELLNTRNKENNILNGNGINIINQYYNNNCLNKYIDEQLYEDDFMKYTSSYRDKMVNKLNEKLKLDNIVDDSLSELKSEKQSISFKDDKIGKNSERFIAKKNEEDKNRKRKINTNNKKSDFDFNIFKLINKIKNKKCKNRCTFLKKREINKSIPNKLNENKNNKIKKLIGLIEKDSLTPRDNNTFILIKDLVKKISKIKDISIPKSNTNMNFKSTISISSRNQSNNKIKINNKNNLLLFNENKALNGKYITNKLIKSNTDRKNEIQNYNQKSGIYTQRELGHLKKKIGIKKNENIKNMTSKNLENTSLYSIVKKNKIKNSPKSSKKIKCQKSRNAILIYNIKSQIKSEENKNCFNNIITKDNDNKSFSKSILKTNIKKKDLINITLNSVNKDYSLCIDNKYKNNKIIKNKEKKSLYHNIWKDERKIKIKFFLPKISPYTEEDKNNITYIEKTMNKNYKSHKNNFNDMNMISNIKNYNKGNYNKKKYENLTINDFFNYNKINKNKKLEKRKKSKTINKN